MKTLKILLLTLVISLFYFNSTSYSLGVGIEYKEYVYKDKGGIINFATSDTFVITDTKRNTLSEFKPEKLPLPNNPLKLHETESQSFKKPLISLRVEEDKETQTNKEKTFSQCFFHTVYFNFDKYNIIPSEKEKIDHAINNFNFKDKELKIYGYASPPGPEHYNLILSAKRAQTVADYLKGKGFIPVLIKGMGETYESNIEARNRKVEIRCK